MKDANHFYFSFLEIILWWVQAMIATSIKTVSNTHRKQTMVNDSLPVIYFLCFKQNPISCIFKVYHTNIKIGMSLSSWNTVYTSESMDQKKRERKDQRAKCQTNWRHHLHKSIPSISNLFCKTDKFFWVDIILFNLP